ncbi:MAG: succinate dehydrogenase assembly factor 2 [Zetaproteobacteria bacterium]|nr:succinate dehydrogenase assembly factor 2 [Zetaproteobacteria bacterium]
MELTIRRLHHRLKCLGMTELDVWLAPLDEALLLRDPVIIEAVDQLLQLESPQLLQMMGCEDDMPSLLKQWLAV